MCVSRISGRSVLITHNLKRNINHGALECRVGLFLMRS